MTSCPLVVNPAMASSQVGHDWRSHILFEVTPAWQGAVTVKGKVKSRDMLGLADGAKSELQFFVCFFVQHLLN